MRVGLIGCSKRKLDRAAPARELYQGDLFRLSRAWLEEGPGGGPRVDAWAILSAKHGVLVPTDEVEPYDLALGDLGDKERRAWRERVAAQLRARWGDDAIYMVIAGADYRLAVQAMPCVEDVIGSWTNLRRLRGMARPAMGIGVIKRYLKERRGYY